MRIILLKDVAKLGKKFEVGDGIFVLSNSEKSCFPFSKDELKLIKPSYTTKELGRYYANRNNSEWVIYTDSKFKYPKNDFYYPKTCSFDCEFKRQHPELSKIRR